MANAGSVLVVEDHETERRALSSILKSEGLRVFQAENADKALGYADEDIDVVLSDLNLGDVSGIDLLNLWKKRKPDVQFILLTGHNSVNSAVEAIKSGAFDYVTKPVNTDELILLIKRAIDSIKKDKEIDHLAPASGPEIRAGPDRRTIPPDEGGFRQDSACRPGGQHGADSR